ncbi:MAG: O-antigen ligase family protein [Patescibacteria group bacterium]
MRSLVRDAAAALAAAACFLLPLLPGLPWLPGVMALLLWLSILAGRSSPVDAAPFVAAGAGWLASFWWRGGGARPENMVDLALAGPLLAAGAASLPEGRWQNALCLGGLVSALAAVAQAAAGQAVPPHWTAGVWTLGRAVGSFRNPNVLAAYLAGVTPLVAARPWPRPARYAALALLALASLAAASRGGWLAASAGLALFLWRGRSPRLPALAGLLAAAALLPWPPGQRLLAAAGADATVTARFAIWARALAAWCARPLAGWGARTPLDGMHPHSLLLEIALQGGLFALAGFVPLAAGILAVLRKGPRGPLAAACAAAALAVYGLADSVLMQPSLAGLFWLSCGLALKPTPAETETRSAD